MAQILMQFCDQKHNAWQYTVNQKNDTGQDKDQHQDQKAQDQDQDKAWQYCQIRQVNAK